MTDERAGDENDALPPPFRPWTASGVPQPGADRPTAPPRPRVEGGDAELLPRLRRDDVADSPAPRVHPAPAPLPHLGVGAPGLARERAARYLRAPVRSSASVSAVLARDRYVVGFAILSAVTAWLPWAKAQGVGMFELTGSTRLLGVANAWDLPAKFLWSTGRQLAVNGGVELGWLVVGLPILMIVACIRDWGGGTLRGLACAQAGVAVLFMAQAYRIVHDTSGPIRVTVHYGTTDVLGFGPYLLLLLSLVLLVAPRH
jgi:hypothetical protein